MHQASEDDSSTIRIWNTNHLALPHPAHQTQGDTVGCLYAKASLVNHSCEPNADYMFTTENHIVIIATRDIAQGEEVTHSYVEPRIQMKSPRKRKAAILERTKFECQCVACVGGRYAMCILHTLIDRSQPFQMDRLSKVNVFNISDEMSRRGAVEANKLVDQWVADFRARVGYWQTIMKIHSRTQGDASMFTNEIVD